MIKTKYILQRQTWCFKTIFQETPSTPLCLHSVISFSTIMQFCKDFYKYLVLPKYNQVDFVPVYLHIV